jgi:ribosomal protein S18 acetylase RimI-like enzyme/ketosteroid isomerase-like protein
LNFSLIKTSEETQGNLSTKIPFNIEVLRRFIAAWTTKDIDALMDCVTDDFVYQASVGPEPGTTYSGRECVRAGVVTMWSTDAGSVAEITSVRVLEDWCHVNWTYRTPLLDGGVHLEVGCDTFEFQAGRISRKNAFRKVRQLCENHMGSGESMPTPGAATPLREVRYAVAADATQLLYLMKRLAAVGGYADRFKVNEHDLLERGLAPASSLRATAQFTAIVAADRDAASSALNGYALVYEIPFTFDLRPTLVIKELYVDEHVRASGIGKALMRAVVEHAKTRSCGRLKWDVLPSNDRAKTFYRSVGGHRVLDWEAWRKDLD